MKKQISMLVAFLLAVIMLVGAVPVSAFSISEVDPENKYKYEEIIINKLFPSISEPFGLTYSEGYEYYSSDEQSTGDEFVPDYVLIYISNGAYGAMFAADMFGDYVLYDNYIGYPFVYGIGVYIPKSGEVYDLVKAYEIGIEGIENVFTEAKVGRFMGDMDNDRKLTIKDATYIQKVISGFEGFSAEYIYAADFDDTLPCSVADFNRDREVNIKDATAIQKYIADLSQ